MKAGAARRKISPPVGTTMMGFATRDRAHGCEGVHDDIYVRALYVEHGSERALVLGYDLCFLARDLTDRYKGAIGRRLDLAPRQILLNCSHTHVGPAVSSWAYGSEMPPDRLYLNELEAATLEAAAAAEAAAVPARIRAGATRSHLPMNRRKREPDGRVAMKPNPGGPVCDHLPICLLEDESGAPICLAFSVSCHPSTIGGFLISADYPGPAMKGIDAELDGGVSLFLQGCGGDAKPSVIAGDGSQWKRGTWDDVAAAGEMVAGEVLAAVDDLERREPDVRSALEEMAWPLAEPMPEAELRALAASPDTPDLERIWAEGQIALLDRGATRPGAASVGLHGLKLADGVRMMALEGEPVAEIGLLMLEQYEEGVTFPLGYTDGTGLYLPTTPMLEEGGYEAESWFEYGLPAPLAGGQEEILADAVQSMRERGID